MSTGLIPITNSTVLQGFNFYADTLTDNPMGLLMLRLCGPTTSTGTSFSIGGGCYTGDNSVPPGPYSGACVVRAIYGVR